jgi:hypothetical protein
MAQIRSNPIMTGASGMLGDIVVYRQYKGKTLMCNRPEKRTAITPHQQKMKSRFLEAVAFAKKMIADPATKALYQPGPESKFTSAYAAALADYLKRPVIDDVDVSNYHGNEGDVIVVKASDIARTLTVSVSIVGSNGEIIDQGEALPNAFNPDYVFRTSKRNDLLKGSTIQIMVKDKPGNMVTKEIVF